MYKLDEKLNISQLLNIYNKLLTPHQAEILRLYFDCDISLFEISEQFNISRQAVRDAICRGVSTLQDIEKKLNFKAVIDNTSKNIDDIISSIKNGDNNSALDLLNNLKNSLED